MKEQPKSKWPIIIIVLLGLYILASFFSGLIALATGGVKPTGNVAVIPVTGTILTGQGGFLEGVAVSGEIVDQIQEAKDNADIKAIILMIDSPGGAPVASREIATAIATTNKTTVAWIRESGASGAYWIASATDYIIADPLSITGSIGVIGSYLDFSGLMTHYNVSYERLVGGQFKDTGIPYRELSPEERRMLQKKIDLMHQAFKDAVAKNRHLSRNQIDSIATGEFYLGSEAKSLGLVDDLGGEPEALSYIERTQNITAEPVIYQYEPSFKELLSQLMSKWSPRIEVSGMQASLT